MADNFDLRKFLAENKLTKNAQIINEGSFMDSYTSEAAKKAYYIAREQVVDNLQSTKYEDLPQIVDNAISQAQEETGEQVSPLEKRALLKHIDWVLTHNQQMEFEGVEEGIHDRNILSRPLSNPAIEPLDRSPEELGKDADARSQNILRMKYRNQINDPNISDEELRHILSGKGVKGFGGTPNAINNILASRSTMKEATVDEAKGYFFTLTYNDAEYVQQVLDDAGVDAVAKSGTFDDEVIVRAFDGMGLRRAKQALEADHFDISENVNEAINYDNLNKYNIKDLQTTLDIKEAELKKLSAKEDAPAMIKGKIKELQSQISKLERAINSKKKETIKENTMTKRDQYLTRLVENALGIDQDYSEEDYDQDEFADKVSGAIDREMYREGEEMTKETVIPPFNTVEELMKEIELRTKKTADKAKIEEMQNIAEAMRTKLKGLEEGEHADHLDEKKLRDLRKNIGILDKTVMKLKTIFDKNYNKDDKKSKPTVAKKEEAPATLAEGFDLRNFLVENKLTTNSKMLSEGTTLKDFHNSDEYVAIKKRLDDIFANESDISFEDAFKEALDYLKQKQPDLNFPLIIKYKGDIKSLNY